MVYIKYLCKEFMSMLLASIETAAGGAGGAVGQWGQWGQEGQKGPEGVAADKRLRDIIDNR
jgi:hypothetical protein